MASLQRRAGGLFTLLAILASSLMAQRTIPVNLERMVQKSGAIVHATVQNIESGVDARTKMIYTNVTVQVNENYYGAEGQTYTFRQFGGKANGIVFYPSKMVRYEAGQELILMLYPKSAMGMQSPVGGEQGVFAVKTTESGLKVASNSLKNRNLLSGVTQKRVLAKLSALQQENSEELPLNDLSSAIRSLVSVYKK